MFDLEKNSNAIAINTDNSSVLSNNSVLSEDISSE